MKYRKKIYNLMFYVKYDIIYIDNCTWNSQKKEEKMNFKRLYDITKYTSFGTIDYYREVIRSLISEVEKIPDKQITNVASKIVKEQYKDFIEQATRYEESSCFDYNEYSIEFQKLEGRRFEVFMYAYEYEKHSIGIVETTFFVPLIEKLQILRYSEETIDALLSIKYTGVIEDDEKFDGFLCESLGEVFSLLTTYDDVEVFDIQNLKI